MAKKTISFRYDGEKVEYRYSISKFRNVRHISIERDFIFGLRKEWDIMIAKADYYCIVFLDAGKASAPYASLGYGTVADIVQDFGYVHPDKKAITMAIMDATKDGF